MKVTYDDASNGSRRLRAAGDLNGGGEVLRLRTVAGNIRLMLSDADKQLVMYRQQMEQLEQNLRMQMRLLEQSMAADEPALSDARDSFSGQLMGMQSRGRTVNKKMRETRLRVSDSAVFRNRRLRCFIACRALGVFAAPGFGAGYESPDLRTQLSIGAGRKFSARKREWLRAGRRLGSRRSGSGSSENRRH